MSMKFKALGLALLAALAVSAVSVMNASATAGGHFVSDSTSTTLEGEDSATDQTQFTGQATVECHTAKYHGTASGSTQTEITVTPTYSECTSSFGAATVTMNGCDYVFTVRPSPESNHNTVHLKCPTNKGPEIHTPTCTITVTANQTPTGGIVYTTGLTEGKHDITADVTVSGIQSVYHGGFFGCLVSEGAERAATMHGTATMWGRDAVTKEKVNITAT